MDQEIDFSAKRVCVTGGAGFLGTHLLAICARKARETFCSKI